MNLVCGNVLQGQSRLTCLALDAVSSTCFSALIVGSEAVLLAGIFFLGEDLAAGDDLAEGEDLAGGDDLAAGVFLLPPLLLSPDGFATATVSLLPSLSQIYAWTFLDV